MSLRSLLLCAATTAALATTATAGQIKGWYIGLEGGANWVEDWSHTQVRDGTRAGLTSFDTGWVALVTAGYAWNNNFRTELELGYRQNDIDTYFTLGNATNNEGSLDESTAMLNVLYDLALMDKLSISFGVGAGGDFANYEHDAGGITGEDDQWNFAYQGIAGLNYMVGQRTALFLNYRYLRVVSPEFDFNPVEEFATINTDDFVKHAATFGVRYALQPAAAPYVPPPSAPPPSGPVAAPRQFIVFFGFNKYVLTSEAVRVISEAVAAAKETGSASILITGHTDTVGSNAYNQRLSMRRSNAVKGEMVRQGVAPGAITTTGKGETELLVQTADGVKEPQNRRATIDLN